MEQLSVERLIAALPCLPKLLMRLLPRQAAADPTASLRDARCTFFGSGAALDRVQPPKGWRHTTASDERA